MNFYKEMIDALNRKVHFIHFADLIEEKTVPSSLKI
jgi:hypothetical protein